MGTCMGAQPLGCRSVGATRGGNAPSRRRIALKLVPFETSRPHPGGLMTLLVIGLALSLSATALSAEPNRPPGGAMPTLSIGGTNLRGSFQLKRGFRIELVASEPMVTAPVAMAFDENGRLFVVEMRDYSQRGGAAVHLGRVRMLEGLNEEGVFQNSTIYADNLTHPSAVACYAGGIFVVAAPDLLYFKDTKGDGVADARQVVMSGLDRKSVV